MSDKLIVFQSDFGRLEGTVSQMYGVALGVDPALRIQEITHNIEPFDIWSASFRLFQSMASWPEGTVFVSVVDPGVGSRRKSIVALTGKNHYLVTPDNGSISHVAKAFGIQSVREIDESVNRVPGSGESHTFHGRDVYGYTGARLASGVIDFQHVGPLLDPKELVRLPIADAVGADGRLSGQITIHDVRFGNVWTNIASHLAESHGLTPGTRADVLIEENGEKRYRKNIIYGKFFSSVGSGEDVLYSNELLHLSLSVNQGSFAETYKIGYGANWTIHITFKTQEE